MDALCFVLHTYHRLGYSGISHTQQSSEMDFLAFNRAQPKKEGQKLALFSYRCYVVHHE